MSIHIRAPASADEFARGFDAIGQYFGIPPPSSEAIERHVRRLPLERCRLAFDGEQVVGGTGAYPFRLSVPGGEVACAGLTMVGVAPTHRRQGLLREMMRVQLEEARARSESISALWASEETIYGRFGYGIASWTGEIAVPREEVSFTPPSDGHSRLRIVDQAEALAPCARVWEGLATQRPGVFSRSEAWWRDRVLGDPPERRGGGGPKRIVLVERDGEARGYAIYRHTMKTVHEVFRGELEVIEAIAPDRESSRDLWRYLLEMDLTHTVVAHWLPVDHPLLLWVSKPRRLQFRLSDALWIRLVDVGAALSARRYAAEGRLVLQLHDAFCPWNTDRWALENGHAERTEAPADLSLDANALGSAYLGGISFRTLADAFRVEVLRPDALERADALFRWPVQPWCPEIF